MKNIYIALFSLLVVACATKYKIADNPATFVLDAPRFENDTANRDVSVDKRYSLSKVSVGRRFILKHNDKEFFNGDATDHYYLDEIFRSRYFFTTVNKKPNAWSSVSLIPRDSVFMYDMELQKLFYFNAKAFRISPVKFKHPLRRTETIIEQQKNGYPVGAIIDSVDVIKNELHLLLEDHKSRAVLKLEPVSRL